MLARKTYSTIERGGSPMSDKNKKNKDLTEVKKAFGNFASAVGTAVGNKVADTASEMFDKTKDSAMKKGEEISNKIHSEIQAKGGLGSFLGDTVSNITSSAATMINDSAAKTKEVIVHTLDSKGETDGALSSVLLKSGSDAAVAIKASATKTKDAVVKQIDANGNDEVDIEDVIIHGLRTPGIKVDRAAFFRKELGRTCSPEIIDQVIAKNPLAANISQETIDQIAEDVIQYERNCVSGISAVLSAPGGVALAATIPADIVQYYGYMLRAAQKLMYLYGFPEIDVTQNSEGVFDSATINLLTIALGTMYGVRAANTVLKKLAEGLGKGVEKQLLKTALTKGTIYPIVKSISKWFGVKMTRQVFAGFFKKAIPAIGAAIGGGITYLTFKPCCVKLKDSLKDTALSNPNYQPLTEDVVIYDVFEDELLITPEE